MRFRSTVVFAPSFICLWLVIAALCFMPWGVNCKLQAAPLDDVGHTDLVNELGGAVPKGNGVFVTQVEALDAGNYRPNQAEAEFSGMTMFFKSGFSNPSDHATDVGKIYYGNTSSMAPNIPTLHAWQVTHWLTGGFLQNGTTNEPATETQQIQNHSWISDSFSTSYSVEALQRMDYVIQRDNVLVVAGQDNGSSSPVPKLMAQLYNGLTVGLTSGNHSHGFTTIDGSGRIKPEIVAPESATSFATPMIAAAGSLLIEHASETTGLSSATNTEVLKALLMAGATKEEFSDWDRTTTRPLDDQFGAGELNIYRSYHILDDGQHAASNSTLVGPQGWDFATTASNSLYFFEVPADHVLSELSATLTWNREIENSHMSGGFTPQFNGLDNLDLKLYDASGFVLGSTIDSSESSVDNVETIYLNEALDMGSFLNPGQYALEVVAPVSGVDYGLAWLTEFQEVHQWTSPAASGSWSTSSNWSATGVPDSNWFAQLDNSSLPAGQEAAIGSSSAVYKASVTGSAGRMTLDLQAGATLSVTSDVEILAGGAITGGGTIQGDLHNESFHTVGAIETLTVSGDADITGAQIVLDEGYTQTRTTNTGSFDLLTANDITGSFSNVAGAGPLSHLGSGYFLESLTQNSTTVSVDIFAALEGDTDGDRLVGLADYTALANNYDPTGIQGPHSWLQGNFDGDSDIDLSDYNALAGNFNPTGYGPSLVPEPSGAALSIVAILFLVVRTASIRQGRPG